MAGGTRTTGAARRFDVTPDRSRQTPLYIQLANNLRVLIADGSLQGEGTLPSERALSEQTGASRVTIRRAIEQLVEEGLVLRRQGSGTFIADRIEQPGNTLSGFTADMRRRGRLPKSIWLIKVVSQPTAEEAEMLKIAPQASVVRLGRVRLDGGQPLAVEHAVVPTELLPPLRRIGQSLYEALASTGNAPVAGTQRIRASLATPVEAGLLSVEPDSPTLRIERSTWRSDGRPVELTRSAYRGDRYEFVSDLHEL